MHICICRPAVSASAARSIQRILERAGISSVSAASPKSAGDADCIIVLGGDKDVRTYFHRAQDASVPVLGISEGESGGFLAQIDLRELPSHVDVLKRQNYTIEEFPRLGVRIDGRNAYPVLNDAAVFPSKSAMLMEHTLRVNGDEVWHDSSDGVIVSTPIGSSAYSMSAGGPVLFQDADVFEIMSVNSLDVTRRPVIASNDSVIEVEDISSKLHCEVVLDGLDRLRVDKSMECTQFHPPARIVRLRKSPTAIAALAKKVHLAEDLLRMPPSSKLILKTLEYEGELTHRELERKTLLPGRTVRLALRNLVEKGYVKKKISARDARQKIYEMSHGIK